MNKEIIDCHTHLQTVGLIEEYFSKRKGYAISIKALDSLIGNGGEFYEATKKYGNVFICECIDIFKPIDEQLKTIKEHLKIYKIVGIKIYLGYQPIFADDKKLYPVYEFAKENGLSVVFHCGVGAENLSSDKSKNFASSLPIEKVARDFPNVVFIASHFDYPNFDDCAGIVMRNPNIFTDISGEFENFDNLPYDKLIAYFTNQLSPVVKKYGQEAISKKVMFGTDYFGIGSGFDAVEEYVKTCEKLFGKQNLNNCLWNNCLKAYPKIKKFL